VKFHGNFFIFTCNRAYEDLNKAIALQANSPQRHALEKLKENLIRNQINKEEGRWEKYFPRGGVKFL
jgi:hypothetical protein